MKKVYLLLLGLTASALALAQPVVRRPSEVSGTSALAPPLTLRAALKTAQVSGNKDPAYATHAAAESRRLTPQQRADLRAQLQPQGREAKLPNP